MAKKFLIHEDEAQLILEEFVDKPYREVFHICEILRNLDQAPDVEQQLRRYNEFLTQKGLWEEFIDYARSLPERADPAKEPTSCDEGDK